MIEIVTADIGGTHARFALARVADGRVAALGPPWMAATAEHEGLEGAWEAFGRATGRPLPAEVAIAFAGPVRGEVLKLVNGPWTIRPEALKSTLGVGRYTILNDFGAVGHAVAQLGDEHFRHLCGPRGPLPASGVISIVGPGTGLGIAQLLREDGRSLVVETEGGHFGYAPLDEADDRIVATLRTRYGRVSAERVVSGSGLPVIHAALEDAPAFPGGERRLWAAALAGEDRLAAAALDRFCRALGAVAGDVALTQGAAAVVIAGGLGLRLADRLTEGGFCDAFVAKGRFAGHMETMPVKLISHPQPGLFGAAAAFARQFAPAGRDG